LISRDVTYSPPALLVPARQPRTPPNTRGQILNTNKRKTLRTSPIGHSLLVPRLRQELDDQHCGAIISRGYRLPRQGRRRERHQGFVRASPPAETPESTGEKHPENGRARQQRRQQEAWEDGQRWLQHREAGARKKHRCRARTLQVSGTRFLDGFLSQGPPTHATCRSWCSGRLRPRRRSHP